MKHEREQVERAGGGTVGAETSAGNRRDRAREKLREQRQQLSRLQEQRGALEVELAQKNMSVQNLRERIQQKYHVNLDDVRSECITITFADEGPAKVHVMTPEEMARAAPPRTGRRGTTDWALQKRLDEIGPVNLVAIEEYEETEQRHQFLSKQNDDLIRPRRSCSMSSTASTCRPGRCSPRRLKKSAIISARCSPRSLAAARRT